MVVETVHVCPRCELRFLQFEEVKAHLAQEHPTVAAEEIVAPTTPSMVITVPVDTDREPPLALAVAAQLGRQLGASLQLVSVPGVGLADGADSYLRSRVRELLADGTQHVTWEVISHDVPATAILDHVNDGTSDLLCLATRSRHGPAHLLFGSVAETVMAKASLPVVLTGPRARRPEGDYRRVVACVDGSKPAEKALAVADRLRRHLGAELHLVEVLDPDLSLGTDLVETVELQRAAAKLTEPSTDYDALHDRKPARAIVGYRGIDDGSIIVLGTHGRTGLDSVVAGSVARGVVEGATVPVLVVPPQADPEAFLAG
jgi:nucleotide-binding universal stress UspA family protein